MAAKLLKSKGTSCGVHWINQRWSKRVGQNLGAGEVTLPAVWFAEFSFALVVEFVLIKSKYVIRHIGTSLKVKIN